MASAKKWMGVTLLATLVIGMGAGVLVDRFLLASTIQGCIHARATSIARGAASTAGVAGAW